jgi:hypothetical protein
MLRGTLMRSLARRERGDRMRADRQLARVPFGSRDTERRSERLNPARRRTLTVKVAVSPGATVRSAGATWTRKGGAPLDPASAIVATSAITGREQSAALRMVNQLRTAA